MGMCERDVLLRDEETHLLRSEELVSDPLPHKRNDPKCTWYAAAYVSMNNRMIQQDTHLGRWSLLE